jgi:membrane associated rhomboid family serine protease
MPRLLARLERSLGRFAIPHLILFVIGGTALVWALSLQHPETQVRLMLSSYAVTHGQPWRLVTFLFVPPTASPMLLFFDLYFMWWIGTSLEQHWGTFKFNVYYFVGVLAVIAAAFVTGYGTSVWLNDESLLLAFATLFPDMEILLFFFLPIRVKWLGLFSLAPMVYFFAVEGPATRASIAASLAGYLLFFARHWMSAWRDRALVVRQRARRRERASNGTVLGQRVCAICGAREADGADIRVCSCEKCGGQPRNLCLEHARNH